LLKEFARRLKKSHSRLDFAWRLQAVIFCSF